MFFMSCIIINVFTLCMGRYGFQNIKHKKELNVGSVLFESGDLKRTCWEKEDLTLLSSRYVFQNVLPDISLMKIKDSSVINDIVDYFQLLLQVVRDSTTGRTRRLLFLAMCDSIGGYLYRFVLPVARYSYYCGVIEYESIEKLYRLFENVKNILMTSGRGWSHAQFSDYPTFSPPPLVISYDRRNSDCKKFISFPSNAFTLPLPFTDSKTDPASIAIPFRDHIMVSVESKRSVYVLVRYYTTSLRCLKSLHATDNDIKNFNTKFMAWLGEYIIPHLYTDKFYPAFGGVLKVIETMKRYGIKEGQIDTYKFALPNVDTELIESEIFGEESRSSFLIGGLAFLLLWLLLVCLLICCCVKKFSKDKKKKEVEDCNLHCASEEYGDASDTSRTEDSNTEKIEKSNSNLSTDRSSKTSTKEGTEERDSDRKSQGTMSPSETHEPNQSTSDTDSAESNNQEQETARQRTDSKLSGGKQARKVSSVTDNDSVGSYNQEQERTRQRTDSKLSDSKQARKVSSASDSDSVESNNQEPERARQRIDSEESDSRQGRKVRSDTETIDDGKSDDDRRRSKRLASYYVTHLDQKVTSKNKNRIKSKHGKQYIDDSSFNINISGDRKRPGKGMALPKTSKDKKSKPEDTEFRTTTGRTRKAFDEFKPTKKSSHSVESITQIIGDYKGTKMQPVSSFIKNTFYYDDSLESINQTRSIFELKSSSNTTQSSFQNWTDKNRGTNVPEYTDKKDLLEVKRTELLSSTKGNIAKISEESGDNDLSSKTLDSEQKQPLYPRRSSLVSSPYLMYTNKISSNKDSSSTSNKNSKKSKSVCFLDTHDSALRNDQIVENVKRIISPIETESFSDSLSYSKDSLLEKEKLSKEFSLTSGSGNACGISSKEENADDATEVISDTNESLEEYSESIN